MAHPLLLLLLPHIVKASRASVQTSWCVPQPGSRAVMSVSAGCQWSVALPQRDAVCLFYASVGPTLAGSLVVFAHASVGHGGSTSPYSLPT